MFNIFFTKLNAIFNALIISNYIKGIFLYMKIHPKVKTLIKT